MNLLTRFGIFCVVLMCSSSVFTAECTEGKGTMLIFANGVGNTDERKVSQMAADLAFKVKGRVKKLVQQGIINEEDSIFEYDYVHNPTPIYNFVRLWRQRNYDVSMRPYQNWLDGKGEYPTDAPLTEEELSQKVMQSTQSPVLQGHISQSLGWYSSGKREIRVCHSQGCFYSNQQYSQLALTTPDWKNSFGLTAVGTPTSSVAGAHNDGRYVTLREDKVINAIRLLPGPDPLPGEYSNASNAGFSFWSSNHQFVRDYLNGSGSSTAIMSFVTDSFLRTPYPDVGLKITLEWVGSDQMRFMIIENIDGVINKVYELEPEGINGSVTLSQNFEAYTTRCATPEGIYQIYVGRIDEDLSAQSPMFKVKVSYGDLSREFESRVPAEESYIELAKVFIPESGDGYVERVYH